MCFLKGSSGCRAQDERPRQVFILDQVQGRHLIKLRLKRASKESTMLCGKRGLKIFSDLLVVDNGFAQTFQAHGRLVPTLTLVCMLQLPWRPLPWKAVPKSRTSPQSAPRQPSTTEAFRFGKEMGRVCMYMYIVDNIFKTIVEHAVLTWLKSLLNMCDLMR